MNIADIVAAPRTCGICLEPLAEWPIGAHSADPVAPADCCESCNETIVIPAREAQL
ncbi:hypothetical protein [Mycolicibacterium sp. GESEQ-9]|uniref:hypothetical protein n=1 Tax=Mycolicibacterium sp. GESEQ-9 TaxID=2812656 RepID=UPI001B33FE22|nr:hypothetical protein [Mycolicibacterium sp. GESEQ-9]